MLRRIRFPRLLPQPAFDFFCRHCRSSKSDTKREPSNSFATMWAEKMIQIDRDSQRKGRLRKWWRCASRMKVFVFGSVYVHSTPDNISRLAFEMMSAQNPQLSRLRKSAIVAPQLSDLDRFPSRGGRLQAMKTCERANVTFQLTRGDGCVQAVRKLSSALTQQIGEPRKEMALEKPIQNDTHREGKRPWEPTGPAHLPL